MEEAHLLDRNPVVSKIGEEGGSDLGIVRRVSTQQLSKISCCRSGTRSEIGSESELETAIEGTEL